MAIRAWTGLLRCTRRRLEHRPFGLTMEEYFSTERANWNRSDKDDDLDDEHRTDHPSIVAAPPWHDKAYWTAWRPHYTLETLKDWKPMVPPFSAHGVPTNNPFPRRAGTYYFYLKPEDIDRPLDLTHPHPLPVGPTGVGNRYRDFMGGNPSAMTSTVEEMSYRSVRPLQRTADRFRYSMAATFGLGRSMRYPEPHANEYYHDKFVNHRRGPRSTLYRGEGIKHKPLRQESEYKKFYRTNLPPHPAQVNFSWRPTAVSLRQVQLAVDVGIFNPNDVKYDAFTAHRLGLLRDPDDVHTPMRYPYMSWPGISLVSNGHRYFRSAVHFEVGDATRRAIGFVEANGGKLVTRFHAPHYFEGPAKHPFYLPFYLGNGLKPALPVLGLPFQLAHWSLYARADKRGYLATAARETLYEAIPASLGGGAVSGSGEAGVDVDSVADGGAPEGGKTKKTKGKGKGSVRDKDSGSKPRGKTILEKEAEAEKERSQTFTNVDHPLQYRGDMRSTDAYARHLAQLAMREGRAKRVYDGAVTM